MRKTLTILAILALALSFLSAPASANHDQIPKNIPGFSATAIPDLSQVKKDIGGEGPYEVVWQGYNSEDDITVAVTTAMPWAPEKVVIWEWRIPTENDWRYFAAFSPDIIIETVSATPIFKAEEDASGNLLSITVTLRDKNGKASGVSKTFTKPK